MRIVFFGTPEFSASFLQYLYNQPDFSVVGVVCQPDEPVGRHKVMTAPPTKIFGASQGIPVFQPTKLRDPSFKQALANLQSDVFVVVAYGRIIPENILDLPPLGCVNVHPSKLPTYRGPSPMQRAILNGDKETAVTIMKLDAGMDTGPILAQETLVLDSQETLITLTNKVIAKGTTLLAETLRQYAKGAIIPTPQDDSEASICALIKKEDGLLNPQLSAEEIDRKGRTYLGWPAIYTPTYKILDYRLYPNKSSVPAGSLFVGPNNELLLSTSTSPLEIIRLQPNTKNPMTAKEFIRGYSARLSDFNMTA